MREAAAGESVLLGFLSSVFLVLSAVGVTLTSQISWMIHLVRLSGIGLVVLYGLVILQFDPKIPAEVMLFGAFVGWGTATGVIVSRHKPFFWDTVMLMAQIWALVAAVAGLTAFKQDPSLPFAALAISATALVTGSLAAGEASRAVDLMAPARAHSYIENPNSLAQFALLGIFGLLFLWRRTTAAYQRVLLVGLFVLLAFGIILSGSRKGFVGLLLMIAAWLWFCFRQSLFSRPHHPLLALSALFGTYLLVDSVCESTYLGSRLQLTLQDDTILGRARTQMYREAVRLFLANPLAGVGFGNFKTYSWFQMYSHSEYMEALSTTGAVGSALYFVIYPVLWRRLRRIEASNLGSDVTHEVGLYKAFVITQLVLALGRINYQSILTMVIMGGVIGHAFALEQDLSLSSGSSPSQSVPKRRGIIQRTRCEDD
jgi:O-antigen ligase